MIFMKYEENERKMAEKLGGGGDIFVN